MHKTISTRLHEGSVNRTDTAFADLLMTLAKNPSDTLWNAAVLTSAAVQNGDVCLPLSVLSGLSERGVELYETQDLFESLENNSNYVSEVVLRSELLKSGVVQEVNTDTLKCSNDSVKNRGVFVDEISSNMSLQQALFGFPLILDRGNRLYLARYWLEEFKLAEALKNRMQTDLTSGANNNSNLPSCELLDKLFPTVTDTRIPDWQRVAAVVATRHRLCVITGGPGTGKTRTVARLLAVFDAHFDDAPRIALLAPTGKAAARLLESLRSEVHKLHQEGVSFVLPDEASTLHRALGYQPGRREFRHNADNPLPFDIVLVDEASMVDLSMQYALVSALTAKSRLILLGDRDQLASVDAGNVLGDIVGQASPHQYSSDQQKVLQACCPGFNTNDAADDAGGMADVIVQLQHSYRFDEKSGIGHFAKAVNQGNAELACAVGDDPRFEDLVFVDTETVSLHEQLKIQALSSAQALLAADSALEAISHLSHFKVLCAIQNGHRGVAGINDFMELQLMQRGLIPANKLWYQGRPLLITRNDRGTDLYNGDTGLIWPDDEGNNMAWFPDGTGHARAIAPGRLPAHQTCFAITVHKTQGSEFSNVLLVLPDPPHTLLSRDLLYTGVTRAKHAVTVYGSKSAICIATDTKRIRASGLYDRLWQDYPSRSG